MQFLFDWFVIKLLFDKIDWAMKRNNKELGISERFVLEDDNRKIYNEWK